VLLQVENVRKSFGPLEVLKGVSLPVDRGDVVAILGPSGSGKTTLLHIIGALETFDGGQVIVDGIDVNDPKTHRDYFANKVGFLFQNFVLIEDMTVRKNLNLIRKTNASGISIAEALDYVGLGDKIDQKVYELSGGEQQRVALARLMIKKCDIILADEPTGSLDRKNAERVLSILEDFHQKGKTVVIVTHDEGIKNRGWRVKRTAIRIM